MRDVARGALFVSDRQDQSDLFTAQLATAGAGIGFFLAAAGFWFVSYGVAIGFLVGAVTLFYAAHSFEKLAAVKLQWPLALAEGRQRGYWQVFRTTMFASAALTLILSGAFWSLFYIFELKRELKISESRQEIRHLTSDQKQRLQQGLQLSPNENYTFQLNSMPSCDECEQFAEELRTFFNTIPGWKAGGGPLIFAQQRPRRGLWLVSRDEEKHSVPVEKISKAFDGAGVALIHSSEEVQPATFVILVARPGL
jgi:hypothetical protein